MGLSFTFGRMRVLIALAGVGCAVPAEAYYHYVQYLASGPPYVPVFEKFDLTALPDNTVTFLVSDAGPSVYATNDDFASVLSQVKQAAEVWNSVAGSALHVAFGGVEAANQPANTPGGDVVFIDLPPGLLGLGTPTTVGTPVNGPNGSFIPILRSTVMLTTNTSLPPGPSYLESFFTTTVHEIGHALGLQHTFTAAAMSQGVIRNTSRTRPIDVDDIAGLLMLYGNAGYASGVGSISGQVISNGQGVNLASVVALTSTGPAISTLTNPDGTYRIDGLPPNQYWVYVHPLPPDAFLNDAIKGPFDASGNQIPASAPFETLFYPGTRNPVQFGVIPVTAGAAVTGINFSVQPRAAVPVYNVATYSYSGQSSATPAYVNITAGENIIAAQALSGTTPVPQSVTVPGFSNAAFEAYGSPVALALYLTSPLISGTGPRHILFNFGNDMYVLPDGLDLVQKGPPAVTSVISNGDGTATIAGGNFGSDSQVFFDGLPATVTAPFSGDVANASITVLPPPGYSGQNASVIVYNSDEQNSTVYQSQSPPIYTYPASGTPQITVTPAALPAGASALVDITGTNMQFVDGQVTVGFGTFDVSAQRIWVLSPSHAMANVVVSPGAVLGASEASVISGFQTAFRPAAFVTQAANPALPSVAAAVDADPNQQAIYPGGFVSLFGSNLAAAGANPQVTLGGQAVSLLYASAKQINFQVPLGFPTGPAILTLNNGSASAFPIAIQIDNPPPVITAVNNAQNQAIGAGQPVSSGNTIFVILSGVDPSVVGSQGLVQVTVAGINMPVLQVTPGSATGTVQVAVQINQSFGGTSVPLVVMVDASQTDPYSITVQ